MNPNAIYEKLSTAGTEWADRLADAELLEGALKSQLAQLTIEAKGLESCSMAEAKELALSSSGYRDAQVAAIEARRQANRARVQYDSAKAWCDASRTHEATQRVALSHAT